MWLGRVTFLSARITHYNTWCLDFLLRVVWHVFWTCSGLSQRTQDPQWTLCSGSCLSTGWTKSMARVLWQALSIGGAVVMGLRIWAGVKQRKRMIWGPNTKLRAKCSEDLSLTQAGLILQDSGWDGEADFPTRHRGTRSSSTQQNRW